MCEKCARVGAKPKRKMSADLIANYIETFAAYSQAYPFLFCFFIFLFMTIESSFIPFPSEVVMIPAGFLVARYDMLTGSRPLDLCVIILIGTAGSIAGAFVNYALAVKLGRPFLHKYGKYFFLKEAALDRAEEIFREYGEIVTFVCRLLPAIRQLISIPAGLARMNIARFTLFTALGAGIWTAILSAVGYYFGYLSGDITYLELVRKGTEIINEHYLWIIAGLALAVAAYAALHRRIMGQKRA